MIEQWIKEYLVQSSGSWITLPISMTSTNYVIVDGKIGEGLMYPTGWTEKKKEQFKSKPRDTTSVDFFIIGY